MHFSLLSAVAILASVFAASVHGAASCTDTTDHHMNGSSRNNTLDAGMDLMSYFNDPARNGVLHLPAQGKQSQYSVTRQVGWVHVGLAVANFQKETEDEDIPLDEALSALLDLITTCTTGSASIGKGQWQFFVGEENHVGKRAHPRDLDMRRRRSVSSDLPTPQHHGLEKRGDKSLGNIGSLAAWPILRLGLDDETTYFGSKIVSFSDKAENPLIDEVAKNGLNEVHKNSDNANEISVGGPNNVYKVKFTLTGFSNWGAAETLALSHGDTEILFEKLIENTMHNIANRRTAMGRFKWEFEASSSNSGGKAINVVVSRVLLATPTSCSVCDCQLGDAKPRISVPNDDQISEAPDDFPKRLPARAEEKMPSAAHITMASGKERRQSLTVRRSEMTSKSSRSPTHLFKRMYGTCQVAYENNNYPSTAKSSELPPNQNKADAKPQITKWVDWEIKSNGQLKQICDWEIRQHDSRVSGREYATEHVFEKHLIASFLKWTKKAELCDRANCPKLNSVFNRVSTTPNSPFTGTKPASAMAAALSDNTRLNEFFILRDEIKFAKTVILAHNHKFGGIPAVDENDSWQTTLQTIRVYSMAFNYMNNDGVSTIFRNTNNRMRAILEQVDNDNFYARPSTCTDDFDEQTSDSWKGIWEEWLEKFITYKEIKMQEWIRDTAVPTLVKQINAQVTNPQTKKEMLEDIEYFKAEGRWMSGGAFQFSEAYHNLH